MPYKTHNHVWDAAWLDSKGMLHIPRKGNKADSVYRKDYIQGRMKLAADHQKKMDEPHPRADLWSDLALCMGQANVGPPPELPVMLSRAREDDGQYKADDPGTPENEAWKKAEVSPDELDPEDLPWNELRALAKSLGIKGKGRATLVRRIWETRDKG